MTATHAYMLAEQDGRGARSAEVCKQHTKNQRRDARLIITTRLIITLAFDLRKRECHRTSNQLTEQS